MDGILLVTYIFLWIVVVFLTILTVTLYRQLGIMVMGTARGVDHSGIPVGRRLPSMDLPTLDGDRWNPQDQDHRAKLLFFGAHYCSECKEIMPYLASLDSPEVEVVTLLMGSQSKSEAYARELGLTGTVAVIDDEVAGNFDIDVTPFAYALDAQGIVQDKGLANSPERIKSLIDNITTDAGSNGDGRSLTPDLVVMNPTREDSGND